MARLEIELAWSPGPRQTVVRRLAREAGATVADALALAQREGWLVPQPQQRVAVYGKLRPLSTPLRDRDRVEVLRPLKVDPKEARRARARKAASTKR
jgi:putative ubiquitin-RnfH superfamily antitoxin RatB of RatAB toxin-antitoxin module